MAAAALQTAPNGAVIVKPPHERMPAIRAFFTQDSVMKAIATTLPRHIKPEKFVRVYLAAMTNSPKLFECTPESLYLTALRAASMGLELDGGVLGQAYPVPYWNNRERRLECQLIPGYRGLIKLARNSGAVADVWAEVVFEKDTFDYELGLEPSLKHKRNDSVADPGAMIYAYAVARFKDGERKFVVMNRAEIERIRNASSSKSKSGEVFGPWVDHPGEMWKKTAIRRLCKTLPLSVEVAELVNADEPNPLVVDTVTMPTDIKLPELPPPAGEGIDEPNDAELEVAGAGVVPDDSLFEQGQPANAYGK